MAVQRRRGRPTTTQQASTKRKTTTSSGRNVTQYADKPPTDFHKAFARWIVKEVGFDPDNASSKRAAFLRGVSIASAARPAFQESDFLAAWREETGAPKPGRKPGNAVGKRKAAPEPVGDDADDFDDDADDADDFDDDADADADADDADDADDVDDDDDDDFDDDESEPEPEPEPEPVKRRTRTTQQARTTPAQRRTKARITGTKAKSSPKSSDDDYLF